MTSSIKGISCRDIRQVCLISSSAYAFSLIGHASFQFVHLPKKIVNTV